MNKVLVLGIDDSAKDRELLIKAFEGHKSIDFSIVASRAEYFDSLNETVKVVLIDHYVPDPVGLEIMADTKERFPSIVAGIASAQTEMEVTVEAFERGCFFYVIKGELGWTKTVVAKVGEAIIEYDRRVKASNAVVQIEAVKALNDKFLKDITIKIGKDAAE